MSRGVMGKPLSDLLSYYLLIECILISGRILRKLLVCAQLSYAMEFHMYTNQGSIYQQPYCAHSFSTRLTSNSQEENSVYFQGQNK